MAKDQAGTAVHAAATRAEHALFDDLIVETDLLRPGRVAIQAVPPEQRLHDGGVFPLRVLRRRWRGGGVALQQREQTQAGDEGDAGFPPKGVVT